MKTIKVLVAVVCVFATLGLVIVNVAAPPRYFKEINMIYWTERDGILDPKLCPVPGNQVSDFKLTLDGSADSWYYLNIKYIKPLQTDGYYPFYLVAPSVTDTAFWDYWAAKGVTSSALGTWQEVMWYILHGVTGCPMFYLKASGGNYMLVDGLQKLTMSVDNPLRLNGDYPLGSYTFIAMPDAGPLAGITMTIMFR